MCTATVPWRAGDAEQPFRELAQASATSWTRQWRKEFDSHHCPVSLFFLPSALAPGADDWTVLVQATWSYYPHIWITREADPVICCTNTPRRWGHPAIQVLHYGRRICGLHWRSVPRWAKWRDDAHREGTPEEIACRLEYQLPELGAGVRYTATVF